jgi:hypothetical protein
VTIQLKSGPSPDDLNLCELDIDHEGKFVIFDFLDVENNRFLYASLSPADAKCVATALGHYAKRAQKVRDDYDRRHSE